MDNLVNNALIYSDPPATVTVTVRTAPGAVEIRVADHGPGVPERIGSGSSSDSSGGRGRDEPPGPGWAST